MIKVRNFVVLLFVVVLIASCGGGTDSSIENQELPLPSVQQNTITKKLNSAMAQQSEVDSLLNSSHETSWAYFRDPSRNLQSKWYISNKNGTTYALGHNNSGHISWVALANQTAVAALDFRNKRVSLISATADLTPSDSYLAISLVRGEANETVLRDNANRWANLIAGNTLVLDWYFFRVESTDTWYIIWIGETSSKIYRLQLKTSKDDYDWQDPLDVSGVPVDTSNWTKEFFQENGIWKVRFTELNSFRLPLPGGWNWRVNAGAGAPNHKGDIFYSLDFDPSGYVHPKGTLDPDQSNQIPIYAMHSGKVIEAPRIEDKKFNGYFVRLDQDRDGNKETGLTSVYTHLRDPPLVKVGDIITEGTKLGFMGATGNVTSNTGGTGKHLHVTLKYDGKAKGLRGEPNKEVERVKIEGLSILDFREGISYRSSR